MEKEPRQPSFGFDAADQPPIQDHEPHEIIDNPEIEDNKLPDLSESEMMQAEKMARTENIHFADAIRFFQRRKKAKRTN
jgi:hypothetical protein